MEQSFVDAVCNLTSSRPSNVYELSLQTLLRFASNSELRDFDWEFTHEETKRSLYDAVFNRLSALWMFDSGNSKLNVFEANLLRFWSAMVMMSEYNHQIAYEMENHVDDAFVEFLLKRILSLARLNNNDDGYSLLNPSAAIGILQHLLIRIYESRLDMRAIIRTYLTKYLLCINYGSSREHEHTRGDGGKTRSHVQYLLQILQCIVRGFEVTDHADAFRIRRELMNEALLPLHLPNEMIEWRDQIPVLQTYHEDLVRCVILLAEKSDVGLYAANNNDSKTSLLTEIFSQLLQHWPEGYNTNTPKQVLLLHEMETLMERCDMARFLPFHDALLDRLVKCVGTNADNIRPAQRALQMFKNPKVLSLLYPAYDPTVAEKTLRALLPALFRGGQASWNPTVNKMTALALKSFMDTNEDVLRRVTDQLITSSSSLSRSRLQQSNLPSSVSISSTTNISDTKILPPRNMPRVPPAASSNNSSKRGAFDAGAKVPSSLQSLQKQFNTKPRFDASQGGNPPVTITGVAPWAMNKPISQPAIDGKSEAKASTNADFKDAKRQNANGYDQLQAYMILCYEHIFRSADELSVAEGKDWTQEQAAMSPNLLPTLKFHDLVFGQVLGVGAFSTVKYARMITKGKAQSSWPEYAVKIIDAKKVLEQDYALSVVREVLVLQLLQHPGIARMVSAFQYHGSAYLILEYASKGDLHSFILQNGRLEHSLLRFVVGEMTAALAAIHEQGFCFNDLKPENILITELGHVKLTDFGACRCFTTDAKSLLRGNSEKMINLRDGNWKQTEEKSPEQQQIAMMFETAHQNHALLIDDPRCEGTFAYMPPEAMSLAGLHGEGNDPLLDSWSLGCVLYFAWKGKPCYYGEEVQVIMEQMAIWFDEVATASSSSDSKSVHFAASGAANTPGDLEGRSCESLIRMLLTREREQRLSITAVLDHPYLTHGLLPEYVSMFTSLGGNINEVPVYDPRSLHQRPAPTWPEVNASGAQRGDARWARRQFSTLWAPMPAAYEMEVDGGAGVIVAGGGGMELGDLPYSVLRSPLPVVTETEVEMTCSFVRR